MGLQRGERCARVEVEGGEAEKEGLGWRRSGKWKEESGWRWMGVEERWVLVGARVGGGRGG